VVGPNRAFLHYISAVLPALGEIEVEQVLVDDLLTRVRYAARTPSTSRSLKQDARLATVLARRFGR
jgi:DNA helicase IV